MAKWWNDNFGPRLEGGLGNIEAIKRQQQLRQGLKDAVVSRNRVVRPATGGAAR